MFGYLKKYWQMLFVLFVLVLASGPFFSMFLSYIERFLRKDFGDWLSFYGAMTGIIISFIVFHLQLSIDKENTRVHQRPELFLDYSFQVIKAGCPIYYHDKYWFGLTQSHKNTQKLEADSFKRSYSFEDKRDKALSFEIVNNKPLFNLQIRFGEKGSYAIVPKLSEGQKIYVVSKEHQDALFNYLLTKSSSFTHVPKVVSIFYTTLSGEKVGRFYKIDEKGQCSLEAEHFNIHYPELPSGNHICDYFIK